MATVVQGHKPGFQLFFFINQSVTFCYFLLLRWCNLFLSSSFPEPRLSSLPSLSISFLVCSPFIILLGKVNIFLRSFSTTSCNHKFHFSTLYSFLFFNAFLLFLLSLYGPFTQFFLCDFTIWNFDYFELNFLSNNFFFQDFEFQISRHFDDILRFLK